MILFSALLLLILFMSVDFALWVQRGVMLHSIKYISANAAVEFIARVVVPLSVPKTDLTCNPKLIVCKSEGLVLDCNDNYTPRC